MLLDISAGAGDGRSVNVVAVHEGRRRARGASGAALRCGGRRSGCAWRGAPGTQGVVGIVRVRSMPVGVASSGFGQDLLDSLFPRDGQDSAQQMIIQSFVFGVDQRQETKCLAAVGLPAPSVGLSQESLPTLAYGDNTMPNLPLMVRTGTIGTLTGYHVPPGPAASMSKAERKAYGAMLARCSRHTFTLAPFATTKTTRPLLAEWSNMTEAVLASPAVTKANARGARCSRHTAFPAASVGATYQDVGSGGERLVDKPAAAAALQAAGVRVMARCFGADIRLQARLLTAKRAAFFSADAPAIHAILTQVNGVVARLVHAGEAPRTVLTAKS